MDCLSWKTCLLQCFRDDRNIWYAVSGVSRIIHAATSHITCWIQPRLQIPIMLNNVNEKTTQNLWWKVYGVVKKNGFANTWEEFNEHIWWIQASAHKVVIIV